MEEQRNMVELIDENDEKVLFEHLMTLDYDGTEYIILKPMDEFEETDEDDEVVILKVEQDENDEDVYVSIDDEEELEEVFEAFSEVLEQEYDE